MSNQVCLNNINLKEIFVKCVKINESVFSQLEQINKKELNQLDILQDQVISYPSEDNVVNQKIIFETF